MATVRDATVEVPHLSVAERVARGKAARAEVPRSGHACFEPAPHRPDPVQVLEQQAQTRVPELVPIRYGRMLVSPFTFYRGAAMIMAGDLAATPRSGLTVQCCGDAHLSNFGVFASPERRLIFDVNDFDETLPGPWEWDVKRLAASMLIAARDNDFAVKHQDQVVLDTVEEYRTAMASLRGDEQPRRLVRPSGHRGRPGRAGLPARTPRGQAHREGAGQGAHARQHVGVLQAHAHGRRRSRASPPIRR